MLWGEESSKCVMVTKGWFRVSIGVILLSSVYGQHLLQQVDELPLQSTFSTNMSLPSRSVVMFTCKQVGTSHRGFRWASLAPSLRSVLCSSILNLLVTPSQPPEGYVCPVGRCHGSSLPASPAVLSAGEAGEAAQGRGGLWAPAQMNVRAQLAPAFIS